MIKYIVLIQENETVKFRTFKLFGKIIITSFFIQNIAGNN